MDYDYEEQENNTLMLVYHQSITYKKYKENNKFMSAVTKFKISKKRLTLK